MVVRSIQADVDAEILILSGEKAVAEEAAKRFLRLAREAVASRGRFSVALSGGTTPGVLFRRLAESPFLDTVPWAQVHLFWVDERLVPRDDPGSNYRLAYETLISQVPLPEENVHGVLGEQAPAVAEREYERALDAFFCGPQTRFDLVLLGMGRDGHTASLFPGDGALQERQRNVAVVEANYEGRPAHRLTLTLPAINGARQVLFLVTGGSKAEIVRQVLGSQGGRLPAQQVQPVAGQLAFLLDERAAGLLSGV
jgi:6-phosphogluconolactonase